MDLPDELASLQRFHGHLGIYVTLGLRMGAIGKRTFGHWKGLRATVRTVEQRRDPFGPSLRHLPVDPPAERRRRA